MKKRLVPTSIAACLVALCFCVSTYAWQPQAGAEPGRPAVPTLGGPLTWSDELVYFDWRIQRNTFLGQCRLLDGDNRRHAHGSFETCRAALEEIKRQRNLPPMRGEAVLVLHGLGDTRIRCEPMAQYLRKSGGYLVFCIGYPSLFDDIGVHAQSLASVVAHLDGIDSIDLVGHSMGNLVIRHYLGDQTNAAAGRKPDPRIKRIVMVAPPNNGSELAVERGDNLAFKAILGVAGQQLGKRWPELAPRLATPACEFGIIAGGKGDASGMLPTLSGDNDGIVSVASTRLAGARDFILVPELHFFILQSPVAMKYTLCFLKNGYFVDADKRRPIE